VSRSGYSDDGGEGSTIWLYRQAVERSLGGKRGQAFLREMVVALDALPSKRLEVGALVSRDGYCALGAVGLQREIEMVEDAEIDRDTAAKMFGIAPAMAAEIMYMNDEHEWDPETPEQRHARIRRWAVANLAVGAKAVR
jgi:hypothetical protein